MIAVKVTTKKSFDKVKAKAQQGNFKSLGHAAAAIRLVARRSIKRRQTASMPGTPPNTRKGQLKRAIVYQPLPTTKQLECVTPHTSCYMNQRALSTMFSSSREAGV
jgi:hypothetical protein